MEIILGKYSGFCSGVRYTVTKAKEELKQTSGTLYCLGEIVHNEKVVDDLKKSGMIFVQDIHEVPDGSMVIFRAHGEKKEVYDIAKEKNLEIIDLTCGKIRVIRNKIEKQKIDSFLVMIGKKDHPETLGTISYCGKYCCVVESLSDIEEAYLRFLSSGLRKVYVVAQTTFSNSLFLKLANEIIHRFADAQVMVDNTICDATEKRQQEVVELSKTVDEMIIIGGKNSSNTKELFYLAMQNCAKVYMVQSVNDLIGIHFRKEGRIGIMAGASTPVESLEEVMHYLESYIK